MHAPPSSHRYRSRPACNTRVRTPRMPPYEKSVHGAAPFSTGANDTTRAKSLRTRARSPGPTANLSPRGKQFTFDPLGAPPVLFGEAPPGPRAKSSVRLGRDTDRIDTFNLRARHDRDAICHVRGIRVKLDRRFRKRTNSKSRASASTRKVDEKLADSKADVRDTVGLLQPDNGVSRRLTTYN